jgi:glycosyltransferase involved in cell wall biosynthesis
VNLAFVVESMRIDGTVRSLLRQAAAVVAAGSRALIAGGAGAMDAEAAAAGIERLVLPSLGAGVDATEEERRIDEDRFASAIEAARIDAVIAVAARPFPFADRVVGSRVPVFYNPLSNDHFAWEAEADAGPRVRAAARTGRIIASSVIDARAQAERFGFDRSLVGLAYLPLDRPEIVRAEDRSVMRHALGCDERTFLVLTAARLDPDHAAYVAPLAHAVESLRGSGLPVALAVVGDGALMQRVRRDAPSTTSFLGLRHDLDRLYHAADVYVGEGSSKLEAARRGIPSIASGAQVEPETAHLAQFVVGPHGTSDTVLLRSNVIPQVPFAAALRMFVESPQLRSRVGRFGAERLGDRYDVEVYLTWLMRRIAGERVSMFADAGAAETYETIDGDDFAELERAADVLARSSVPRALIARRPVAWSDYLRLDERAWLALGESARRYPV